MVGIDAADINYINLSLDSLPNLRQIFTESDFSRLDSPAGIINASVWPTFYTATLPGEHGYYFPMQWNANAMRLRRVSGDWLYSEPFWYEFARKGIPFTALDVQTAFPGHIARGVEIINWGSQSFEALYCNRPELARDILRGFGRHPMGPDIPVRKTRARLEVIRKDLLAGAKLKGELSRWLMAQTEWRLFITVFTECHRGGHYFWPDEDVPDTPGALLEIYQAVDREIGAFLSAVDLNKTTVIVFSLHGMGPNDSQAHFMPQIMDRINATFKLSGTTVTHPFHPQRSLMRVFRQRLPAPIQEVVARSVPERLRDWVTSRAFGSGFDWASTPGFALPSGVEGYIRCNLGGREAEGVIPKDSDAQRRYMEHVKREFLSLKVAGTDESLVRDVIFPGEHFPGRRSNYLPDIVVLWQPKTPATKVYSDCLGTFTGELLTGRAGNHRSNAFAAVVGYRPDAERARPLNHIADFSRFIENILVG